VSRWLFIIGLAIGLGAGWLLLPELLYSEQEQPMDFNHAIHAEDAEMSCEDCHVFREDGSFADCHDEALGESESERRLVDEYVVPDVEIPWLIYSRQPQNVYFSHAAHVQLAEIECRRCHGDQGVSETLTTLETNRISTYSRRIWGSRISGGGSEPWDSMKMNDCSDCHAERGVKDHCLMCHK
jgi:menaquinone reductase, multiheme cytochrome c subunit